MLYFLKKRILLDTDAGELMRCKQILDANGISYDVKTTTSEKLLARRSAAYAAAFRHEAYAKTVRQGYVYHLYVSRKDYEKAKKLIG